MNQQIRVNDVVFTVAPKVSTQDEALRRYPRLIAHLICVSLGYFTPRAAANAVLDHLAGRPDYCEWFCHVAGMRADRDRSKTLDQHLVEFGRQALGDAFRQRRYHVGFMADYPYARLLVEQDRRHDQPHRLASWF